MKRVTSFFSLTLVIILCSPAVTLNAFAADATRLLDKVIQAHGAQRALSCNSVVLSIDAILDPLKGHQSPGQILVKSNLFRLEYDLEPNVRYRMGYDGVQAWLIASRQAKAPKKLDRLQVALFQFYALVFSPRWLVYLREHSKELEHTGQETFYGTKTETLRVNVETIGNVDFLIDARSYLLKGMRFVFPGENRPLYEIIYDSYFDKGGIKIARSIDIFRNNSHYRGYRVIEARLCENIADTLFAPDLN